MVKKRGKRALELLIYESSTLMHDLITCQMFHLLISSQGEKARI
jgi:hypothetical protein